MKTYISIFFAAFALLISCQNKAQEKNTLSPLAFSERLTQEKNSTLIDVRTKQECEAGIIEKAIHIDFFHGDLLEKTAKLDKEQPVFIYCASGKRSNKAMLQLIDNGFLQVYQLDGGITAWADEGHKIVPYSR